MDHKLSPARQRAVLTIAAQKQRIMEEAQRLMAELDEALADLAATYSAGMDGRWAFAQGDGGEIVLRKGEETNAIPSEGQSSAAAEEGPLDNDQGAPDG